MQASFANLESSIQSASDSPARTNRLAELPKEIAALQTLINDTGDEDTKGQLKRLVMDRSIEQATLSAQVQASNGDFGSRMSVSTRTGLSILNEVIDSIPRLNECLMGDNQQAMGSFLAATVKVASAFASSGQDITGSQLATTVSKLTGFAREQKYSEVLRKLNQQEFMASMACLMEVTSESYCQARSGMQLFKKGMVDLRISQGSKVDITSKNPFAGYYVLNTHVPNITKWMQKIQIGVDPKLPTDAIFQNKIQDEVTNFNKSVKTLVGEYNSTVSTIQSTKEEKVQRNTVFELLKKITESMVGRSGFGRSGDDQVNFFTRSTNPIKIPFDLIGMPVPDQVSGKAMPKLDWDEWIQANLDSIQAFKDPEVLAETIGSNMNDIVRSANTAAIEYFNRWYIVDKAALVNESTIDVNYTVVDSLKAVHQYLESEKQRITQYGGNVSLIPTIVDTQIRINNVLKGYFDLDQLGKSLLDDKTSLEQTVEQVQATADTYEKLVNVVYDQFNVMLSRSGFLANRMVNFVYADYILLLKNKVNFTQAQQDVLTSMGMAGVDKMLQIYNGNPANIQTDLNMALRINKGNIEALDELLKDSIIRTIKELDLIKNDQKVSFWGSVKSLVKDQHNERTKGKSWYEKHLWISDPLEFSKQITNTVSHWLKHADRYMFSNNGVANSPQSEFQDAENVKAQLCIQALAFNDQTALYDLCKGAVLKSPLGNDLAYLNMSYNQKLTENLNDPEQSIQMKKSLNHSARICAFRDYNMRNMARFMSISNQNSSAH